jgi:serine protease
LRFYDDNPLARGAALSASSHAEVEQAAGFPLRPLGRDDDGAFRFEFALPVSPSEVRAALNRLRATGALLYADLAAEEGRAPAKAAGLIDGPVTSLIVKLAPSATGDTVHGAAARSHLVRKSGMAAVRTRAMSGNLQLLQFDAPQAPSDLQTVLDRLASDPDVAHVEVDRRAQVQAAPSDPLFASQWNLNDAIGGINAPQAWDLVTGDPGMPIAVLDTGLLPHPDLAGRVAGGYDFVSDPVAANDGDGRDADAADPGDYVTAAESSTPGTLQGCAVKNSTWHGTMVAGTLGAAGNNGNGVSGVNWSSPLINVRVLGKCGGSLSDIADGIRWAAGLPVPGVPANPRPARVINLSIAGSGACGPILQGAITDALAQGAILVAAAGNDGGDVDARWPANCNGVIVVGATSKFGSRAFYSNFGARVALSAPGGGAGGNIPILRNSGLAAPDPAGYGYDMQLGSSIAAPHVAGAISLALAREPDLTPAEVQSLIERTARPFPQVDFDACTTQCGAGIVDAAAALAALGAPAGIDPPSPAPVPAPAPAPAPPVTPSPPPPRSLPPPAEPITPIVASPPPAFPVPVARGWRAKSPEELARLLKDDAAVNAMPAAHAPGSVAR